LLCPGEALAATDRVAEDDSVVSTTSPSYVDLGGPSLTVNIGSGGTPVSIWFYAQAMQSPPISGQTSWFEVLDNGALIGQSFWDNSNAGWGEGLWSGTNQPSTGAQNITIPFGTFVPSHGKHTYQVLLRAGETGKHPIKLTIVENQISTANPTASGSPTVGTTTVRAGVASLTPGGRGADVDHLTVTSLSLATRSGTFKGRVTFFFLSGTFSAKSVGHVTVHMDGSVTFSGATTFTSGTGAYRGVSGHLTFTGGSPNKPGSVTRSHLTGTATY
jgi:hypothetical protein